MQGKNRQNNLITFFLLYSLLWLLWWQFFGSRHTSQPVATATVVQQAQQKEKEARDPEKPTLSQADRVKLYNEAIAKYQEIYHREGSKPVAIDARYQELRLLTEMSTLEKENTAYYTQAETLLKDMEAHLSGKSAEVVLTPGKPPTRIPDVGKDATAQLQKVREERDVRNRHDIRYVIMDWLVRATGMKPWFSYWFALCILTVVLKTVLWPFSKKQFTSMRDMQRIQPLVKELQEKMKGRPPDEIQKRMFQLYKEHNVNMAGGCLPTLMQMVVLIPVFYMVQMYEFQFSKGYFLWIGSEWAHRWPMWFGKNLASFDVPMFFLYLGSTMLYSILQPKPADPTQAQQQKIMMWMMPFVVGFFMWIGKWSSAFMFYWLTQNIVSLWQNWMLLREFGPAHAPAATSAGGGSKSDGSGGSPVPAPPLKPMQSGPTRNGNSRPASARVQPKKKKPKTRT